ncbi:hypothetical protein [Pseudodonghicola xiamenensis]|uniref:Uncharacterized protein n=1 Tax=Pseudodonghicola xiamenensis TaxID=337702 RepID=A0A8J3MEF0_9RHOB|nr:hypothetical protein [Pseudodonghicola xiamenensis]GHG97624.1 hypothetical protein GCM10010961_32470 [Pseudodonghicola xiamenensis]
MLKCTLNNGNTLFLNMERVIQITKSEDMLAMFFTDQEGEVQRRQISEFEILQPGTPVS